MTVPFKRHNLAANAHPLVKQLITIMNERRISKKQMSLKAGVEYSSFASWQYRGFRPHLNNIEACLNVLGYELVMQKRSTDARAER